MNRSTPSEFLSLRLDAVDLAVESIRADLAALQQPDGEQQQPFCASIYKPIDRPGVSVQCERVVGHDGMHVYHSPLMGGWNYQWPSDEAATNAPAAGPQTHTLQDQIELFIAQELQRHWQDAICPDHGGDWQSLTDAQRAAWRRLVPVARKLINTQTTQKQ